MMTATLDQQRMAIAISASAIGIAVSWLTDTPLGLLAPIVALFLVTRGQVVPILYLVLAVAFAGSLVAALSYSGAGREIAVPWASFCAVAFSIGAIVATSDPLAAGTPRKERRNSAHAEPLSYPILGPTSEQKGAPRNSSIVRLDARDNETTLALMVAASFWGGTPFHLRYWRRGYDGDDHWTEIRTQPLRESGHILRWQGVSTDVDEVSVPERPSKTASNPPSDEDAVRAAKFVERLLGNSWAFDSVGRPTYLTPFAQTFVSATLDEFQAAVDDGDTFFKRTSHPDDYEHLAAAWRRSLKTGEPFYIERRIRRASGIFDWSRTAIVPTHDDQGRVTGWYGASMDLDAYRIAELALRDREQELSQLVNLVPSHLWRLTPDGEPVFFNKRMVDYLGFDIAGTSEPEVSGLDAVVGAIYPDDAAAFRDALGRSLSTGDSFELRYRLRRVDGVYRWMSSRAEPMRDHGGRIVQWYGLCHDIDDQMRAEEALRERERSLSQLVETLPAMIDCAAPNGEPIYRSQQLREFLGYQLEDFDGVGKSRLDGTLDASVHPDDIVGVREQYAHSLATGAPYARRHRLRRSDGEFRWVETRAAPMRNADGAIVQWNVICLDIEGEVRAQQELRLAQEKMARASQASSLAELSASIAHEVNQPLAAIVATSHACRRWLAATPPNLERAVVTLERIIRDANSASEVVSRIRALFRRSTEERTSGELGGIVAEACDLMAEEAVRHRTRLDVEVASGLPTVALDRVQIQQVLVNLIRNGMEAMNDNAGDKIIRVFVRQVGEAAQIDINDCGQGLEFPDRIFEPFFTTKPNGMGMGLAICRSIIESHGGRLWAEKHEPKGSKFTFTLPFEKEVAL